MSFATGMGQSVVGVKTAVETPAEIFAGANALANRTRMRITNLSTHTRIRYGRQTANLQRDGAPVEPGDTVILFPTVPVFACSEGKAIQLQIEEN
ncbi:hypothetical protein RZS08_23890 [Arthrospira platensis SPKY1]|nr:hypothetical protein [Arthrospira platensis SPKY1]